MDTKEKKHREGLLANEKNPQKEKDYAEEFKKKPEFIQNEWFYDTIEPEDLIGLVYGFIIIEADPGLGKTLTAVSMAVSAFYSEGRGIVSNIHLNLYKDPKTGLVGPLKRSIFKEDCKTEKYEKYRAYKYMTAQKMTEEMDKEKYKKNDLDGNVLIIDEVQTVADARSSGSKENEAFGALVDQFRKRNLFVIMTTQNLRKVDVKFREAMSTHITMLAKKRRYYYVTRKDSDGKTRKVETWDDIYRLKIETDIDLNDPKSFYHEYNGIAWFPYYDTFEKIDKFVKEDKQKK